MQSRWSHEDAAAFDGPIGGCVYCSRLIGSDRSLVLHGGGNSSVKAPYVDITGRPLDAIYVKGSGWDMGSIDAAGFAALRLDRLRELLDLDVLSDADMARELNAARLDPAAPSPSVESLLHAFLPYAAVQHSHADAIINLTNVNHADRYVRTVYGDDVVVIPCVKPGFDLARLVRTAWTDQLHDGVTGMVLMKPRPVHFRRRRPDGLRAPRRPDRSCRTLARRERAAIRGRRRSRDARDRTARPAESGDPGRPSPRDLGRGGSPDDRAS
jgi:rhamnose utilization protein RhaD (predicted bifunctional aldolase and dehydrogenase)